MTTTDALVRHGVITADEAAAIEGP